MLDSPLELKIYALENIQRIEPLGDKNFYIPYIDNETIELTRHFNAAYSIDPEPNPRPQKDIYPEDFTRLFKIVKLAEKLGYRVNIDFSRNSINLYAGNRHVKKYRIYGTDRTHLPIKSPGYFLESENTSYRRKILKPKTHRLDLSALNYLIPDEKGLTEFVTEPNKVLYKRTRAILNATGDIIKIIAYDGDLFPMLEINPITKKVEKIYLYK